MAFLRRLRLRLRDDRPSEPFTTRYYALYGFTPEPRGYFSVASGGCYERWCPVHGWGPVTSKTGRDYYSREIENGDDAVRMSADEVARAPWAA